MELKDIVLKKGDIVYFDNSNKSIIDDINNGENVEFVYSGYLGGKIIKIERPHYETIYEAPKEILNKEEKEWLENFLRPFKYRVLFISKCSHIEGYEYICIHSKGDTNTILPDFESGTMYKGMKLDKEYTLDELGLFKGE